MLISFIVPVYNVENYLKQCIDSILIQKGASFEILLIDDGSTDNSGLICDQYAQTYPNIIRVIHKENEGLLLTRRRGFVEAKGDWYACVDSDDYIKLDYLQSIIQVIDSCDCDLVMFDYESFYPNGETEQSGIDLQTFQIFEENSKEIVYKKRLLENKYNNMWSKIIKNTVIDNSIDYSVYGVKNMCEDAIQSYEIYSKAKKIIYLPKVLYMYRRNIKSITSNISLDYWNALNVSYTLGWKYLKQWKTKKTINHAYATRCISFYCDYIRWLFHDSGYEKTRLMICINKDILGKKHFSYACQLFEKKYLATYYLKVIDPIIIKILKCNNQSVKIRLLQVIMGMENIFSIIKQLLINKRH